MVEVPEHYGGKRGVADVIQIGGVRGGLQTIGMRRFQDVSGLTAVAGNAAGQPQLSQWNPASVVSKDNAEGGCPALHRLHLQNRGRANPLASEPRDEWQRFN